MITCCSSIPKLTEIKSVLQANQLFFFEMATLKDRIRLTAVNGDSQEEHSRNNLSRDKNVRAVFRGNRTATK